MPELAEVEWYRKQWDIGRGAKIIGVKLHPRKRIFRGTDTGALKRCLPGEKLLDSFARGKRIFFKFTGNNILGIHLGMTGTLRVDSVNLVPGKHDHLVLRQAKGTLVFRDSRQFGRVRFHHGAAEPAWWKSDVPEIISPQFNQQLVNRFLDRHGRA